jgi:hypothetical protein
LSQILDKWKGHAEESKKHMKVGEPLSFHEIKGEAKQLTLATTRRTVPQGEQYKPKLPMPKKVEPQKQRISFIREVSEVKSVAEYLFGDTEKEPSEVGEKCFEVILKEARS